MRFLLGAEPEPGDATPRQDTVDHEYRPDPVRVHGDPAPGTDAERTGDVCGDRGPADVRRGARDPGRVCVAAEGTRLLEVD